MDEILGFSNDWSTRFLQYQIKNGTIPKSNYINLTTIKVGEKGKIVVVC